MLALIDQKFSNFIMQQLGDGELDAGTEPWAQPQRFGLGLSGVGSRVLPFKQALQAKLIPGPHFEKPRPCLF